MSAMVDELKYLLKRNNESALTYRLKWAAWQWLYEQEGCRAIGFEVLLEGPGGRVSDLAAVGPENRIYIVEVKSSRSDLSRDDHTRRDAERIAARAAPADNAIEFTAGVLEVAASIAKKQKSDEWRTDPAYQQAEKGHKRAVGNREALSRRLGSLSTKFHDPAYLRAADCHYIMQPSGLIGSEDVPPYWGLLDGSPRVVVEAPAKQVKKVPGHALRAIARANTRDLMLAMHRFEAHGDVPKVWKKPVDALTEAS